METAATSAINEISRPDSFYLVPCRDLRDSNSDNLQDILDLLALTVVDYIECQGRHNNLVEQLK